MSSSTETNSIAISRRKKASVNQAPSTVTMPAETDATEEAIGTVAATAASAAVSSEPSKPHVSIVKPETIAPISSRMSRDNYILIDNIYRSRMTLLDLLDARGYDVTTYRKFSPAEATAAAGPTFFGGLSFIVSKRDAPEKKCDVRYIEMTRQKIESVLSELSDEEVENTEYIMMMKGAVTEAHHLMSLKQFMRLQENADDSGERKRRKLHVSFFSLYALVNNPLNHVLVPKHEILPESEHKALLDSLYVNSKSKLPEIKYHVDPIARCIGAVPGDIVKITRYSASAGEAILYRVCSP